MVSLASRLASASPLTGIPETTGPKISSRAARSSLETGDSTTGGNQKPSPSGALPRTATGAPSGTKEATASRCPAEISGPIWVDSSSGSPTLIPSTTGAIAARKSSSTDSSTRIRERAQQSWPALSKPAQGAAAAPASTSASAKTTLADLPPSSSVTRLIVSAAPRAIPRPTSVEPVKAILATSGCSTRRLPQTLPGPTTTFSTPSGIPAKRAVPSSRTALSGVSSAGFKTIVLPAASAGATFQAAIVKGKFQGTINPTTPSGSRKVISTPPATGIVLPTNRSGAPA